MVETTVQLIEGVFDERDVERLTEMLGKAVSVFLIIERENGTVGILSKISRETLAESICEVFNRDDEIYEMVVQLLDTHYDKKVKKGA